MHTPILSGAPLSWDTRRYDIEVDDLVDEYSPTAASMARDNDPASVAASRHAARREGQQAMVRSLKAHASALSTRSCPWFMSVCTARHGLVVPSEGLDCSYERSGRRSPRLSSCRVGAPVAVCESCNSKASKKANCEN